MSQSEQSKVCAGCGADVSHAQRMKDAQGRYICAACVAKIRARKQSAGAGGGSRGAGGVGGGAASVRVGGASDQGADLREFMAQAKQAAKNQCPSCGVYAQPGAVICLNCGYDARSQSQLQTKFGTARAKNTFSPGPAMIWGGAVLLVVTGVLVYLFVFGGMDTIRGLIAGE